LRDKLLEILNQRHACKIFDTDKKISKDDIEYILEVARLSPSSFGMEPWRMLVISNNEVKNRLKPICWNQNQIDTCSHLIVIVAQKESVKPYSQYVKDMFARRGLDEDMYNKYLDRYAKYLEDNDILSWADSQCHILASHICNASAFIGADSCMIGGFEKDRLEDELKIDKDKEFVSLVVALGYRVNPASTKLRHSLDKIVEYID
jgi:nitroreductase